MQIISLKLNNFSSYEGINTFNLSTNGNQSIILIGGQNGAGKTSLFTAIKIALYGPLSFGYTGANSFYYKKIKEYINSNAFNCDELNSGVSVEFSLKLERDIKRYIINRNWKVQNKKIVEDYSVYCDEVQLLNSDLGYFENYLNTIIPPELFDFFLFDGEEVASIFSNDNYNTYLKNAILIMCEIDTFSIIHRFSKGYINKSSSDIENTLNSEYNKYINQMEEISQKINNNNLRIQELKSLIEQSRISIEDLENKFKALGGIFPNERNTLLSNISSLDKNRSILSSKIKSFVENEMPFYIVKDFIKNIETQIGFEEKSVIYEYIKNMISKDFLFNTINGKTSNPNEISIAIYDAIDNRLKPKNNSLHNIIFNLSHDDVSRVESVINLVDDINPTDLIDSINKKKIYTQQIKDINAKLKNSLSENEVLNIQGNIVNENNTIINYEAEMNSLQLINDSLEDNYNQLERHKDEIYQKIIENAQNRSVYELNLRVGSIMDKLISIKTEEIRELLGKKIIENLNNIYRKDNLISIVEITKDFKFNLFQKQEYSALDLLSLINNVGTNEFLYQIGENSKKILLDYFKIDTIVELKKRLKIHHDSNDFHTFSLYKRIELSRLSKGERQIFILSLYWAIVQISNKNIPFIIDTPYARIDANHREEISKTFFPNISNQVIILSTDEEITQEYYSIMKPYISKEYLLINDENKTSIKNRYFFEV